MQGNRSWVVLCALLVTLGGCSRGPSGPPPATTPASASASPVATATPKPTATPGPVPAAARANTTAGAEAFARFYFQRLNMAFSDPEQPWIRGLYTGHCNSCRDDAKSQRQLVSMHAHMRGPAFKVAAIVYVPYDVRKSVRIFDLALDELPSNIVDDSTGRIVQRGEKHRTSGRLLIERGASGWLFSGYDVQRQLS